MINFCIMAAGTASIVMIDHSGTSFGQCKNLRQGHLFSEYCPAFAAVIVVRQAIVRIGEHQITA